MSYQYLIICETYITPNFIQTGYGIAAAELHDDSFHIIYSISNIHSRLTHVKQLVDLCNRLELDPIHLSEVVDDLILNI